MVLVVIGREVLQGWQLASPYARKWDWGQASGGPAASVEVMDRVASAAAVGTWQKSDADALENRN